MQYKKVLYSFLLVLLSLGTMQALAVGEELSPATVTNDEGGVVKVVGVLPLDNPNIKIYTVDPVVILEDQVNFVARDLRAELPQPSQVFARFLNDFYGEGAVNYELLLPIAPEGTALDLNHDDQEDLGVQVYQIAHWDNRFGDAYLDKRDAYGWSGAYSSAKVSDDPRDLGELTGGKLLIWAPDDAQAVSAGFGEDKKLFTDDDPLMGVPAGWSVLNLDAEPFTLDRSQEVTVDLIEPESAIPPDFSELSYTEAFDSLVEWGKQKYAFNELKNMDWDAISAEFRTQFEEADKNSDADAYFLAIDAVAKSIPDGHVSAVSELSNTVEQDQIAGGLGFSLRELSDGRLLVIYVLDGSPASEAGMVYGAEVTALNGTPISDAIDAVESVNGPYSSKKIERLDQVRFVTRFPLDTEVEVTFKNPSEEEQTVTMTTIDERDSLRFTRQFVYGSATGEVENPLEFQFLPSGYGYVEVNDFYGNETLLIKNWEYFLDAANAQGTPGIIIDLRTNGGGFTFIGNRMASYLYDEEFDLGYNASFDETIGEFYYDPRFPEKIEPEYNESKRYYGKVVVLVGPGCASACEFFAYALTRRDRSVVVGQYGSNSIGGGVEEIPMPEGITFRIPSVRPIDPEGNVYVEESGIQPDVVVEITEDNMSSTEDLVLDGAIQYLDEAIANEAPVFEVVEAGALELDTPIDATIEAGQRINYTFNTGDGGVVNFVITGDAGAFINLYLADGSLAADGTSPEDPGFEEVELPPNFDLIVQVLTTDDAGSGNFTISVVPQK